jgi:hypothetical protein
MPHLDLSKYNINNYTEFNPNKIKSNSTIMILGNKLAGKSVLSYDLTYKIMAHRNIIIHPSDINKTYNHIDNKQLNNMIKKKYNRVLPICEFHEVENIMSQHQHNRIYDSSEDNMIAHIDKIFENSKNSDEKRIFMFEYVHPLNKKSEIKKLENLFGHNYFIYSQSIDLSSNCYTLHRIVEQIDEYDYIFLFNSYENNFDFDINQLNDPDYIRLIGSKLGLCDELSTISTLKAFISSLDKNDYVCLVIDNTIDSNNILDKIFWYKAENNLHLKIKKKCNMIGEWFLECKYNPKYKYCKDRLIKEYEELYGDDSDSG